MSDHFSDWWPMYAIGAAIVLLFSGMIAAYNADAKQWRAFASTHDCHVVERMNGDLVTTVAQIVGGNGGVAVGVSSTPNKVAYLCNDGVKYWRDYQ